MTGNSDLLYVPLLRRLLILNFLFLEWEVFHLIICFNWSKGKLHNGSRCTSCFISWWIVWDRTSLCYLIATYLCNFFKRYYSKFRSSRLLTLQFPNFSLIMNYCCRVRSTTGGYVFIAVCLFMGEVSPRPGTGPISSRVQGAGGSLTSL